MYDTRTAKQLAKAEKRSRKGNGSALDKKKWDRLQAQAKLLVQHGYGDFALQGYHARRNRGQWTNGTATLTVYNSGEMIELPIQEMLAIAA